MGRGSWCFAQGSSVNRCHRHGEEWNEGVIFQSTVIYLHIKQGDSGHKKNNNIFGVSCQYYPRL